jgi:hypothetical protein
MNEITEDIWDWITGYVEVNHKFYNYQFPPCPYAKSARLKGLVDVVAYDKGPMFDFINNQTSDLVSNKKYNVRLIVFPPRYKYRFGIQQFIKKLNATLIPYDYYAQYGIALKTKSKYKGWFNTGPYFIVIVNKLSDVLDGHKSLLNTDYYKPWAEHHYNEVVVRRQQMYKHHQNNDIDKNFIKHKNDKRL